jgi:hypothetical protein
MTPCSLVDRNEHFVGTFCFHHYCRTGKRTSFGFIHHVAVVCSDVSEERTRHLQGDSLDRGGAEVVGQKGE